MPNGNTTYAMSNHSFNKRKLTRILFFIINPERGPHIQLTVLDIE